MAYASISAMRPIANQAVAFTTATTIANPFTSETYCIRLATTAACYVTISEAANVVAATAANGFLMPANWVDYIVVSPGQKLSAVQQTAGGTLSVTEMA